RPGDLLAQIRFQRGEPLLTDGDTAEALDQQPIIIHRRGDAMHAADLRVASGIFLSVHLTDSRDITIGYRARKNTPPIDLRAPGTLSVRRHWERLYSQSSAPMILQPDEFYIFSSQELVRIPPAFCAEMVPFDAGSGELRTHYAGFFDSGFGYAPNGDPATSAAAVVLEIRNRDVPFLLEEGHPLFRVTLLRNTALPGIVYGAGSGSSYQGQRLRLSKQFRSTDDDDAPGQGRLDFAG
ncbi:MAG: 2'-deoxycytidine 5'-triphosphate deaminase, partial [Armatimonadetes bacterium]|nr:2'-deoxycytidine 5'-triphosphate deaminase [Armatimonadota bacterium]